MTFTYEGAELSSTLKTYTKTGDEYRVVFLDGTERTYRSNSTESTRLDNLLLEQALKRDAEMQISIIELKRILLTFCFVFCNSVLTLSLKKREEMIGIAAFILTVVSLDNITDLIEKVKELKKYKVFIEMIDQLKLVDNTELLKCVEFDNIYQIPISLSTIDEYSYAEVKCIRRELKRMLNEKSEN